MAMRRGATTASVSVFLLLHMIICEGLLVMAVNHTVGGSGGWSVGTNYSAWASSRTFSAGDVLVFTWSGNHDVVEVSKSEYDACLNTTSDRSYENSPAEITLSEAGRWYYFICSVDAHCDDGMKLSVLSSASASAPAPAPITTTIPSSSASSSLFLLLALTMTPISLWAIVESGLRHDVPTVKSG